MNKLTVFFMLFISWFFAAQSQNEWQTYYEINNQNKTQRFEETIHFSKKLADTSPLLEYKVFGKSHQGRELGLLILDKKGNFNPEDVKKSGNTLVLVQAAIHPGEPVGKDAGLLLIRDIVIHGKYLEYLDNVTLLFIPIINPDGHERFGPYNRINQNGPEEMGWRTNALNLNLNRDYLKADSKEIRAFLNLWHQWEPDFFIDTHSTNGGDYQYTMTYAINIYGDGDQNLIDWLSNEYLPTLETEMENDGYPLFPYVTYRSWHDPRSGLMSGVGHPMYSNSYVAELNRPGLLLETHMLKPYPMRVESTYLMILHTIKFLHSDKKLREIIDMADRHTASKEFRKQKFPLRFETLPDSVMVDFKGVEYTKKVSTLTGGNWFIYNSQKPVTYSIPWFKKSRITNEVVLPDAYIIPIEYANIIERLNYHGIEITLLEEDQDLQVQTYLFSNVQLASRSNEGRQTATFTVQPMDEVRIYPAGSAMISMNQSRARIIAHALEPMAPGSFAYWGFFNAIFERVEYFESYVMEKMAREMISQNPSLMDELKLAMEENPSMANNSTQILTWFYERTPYYDSKHNVYPVGRIFNQK